MKPKVIAVDLDGTLTEEICWNKDEILNATPNNKIVRLVNEMYENGYFIIIYSARRRQFKKASEKWLRRNGVNYHQFGPRKMVYDWLIDDHAVRPDEL
jgi:uncharacterized HAD superfamily protein